MRVELALAGRDRQGAGGGHPRGGGGVSRRIALRNRQVWAKVGASALRSRSFHLRLLLQTSQLVDGPQPPEDTDQLKLQPLLPPPVDLHSSRQVAADGE